MALHRDDFNFEKLIVLGTAIGFVVGATFAAIICKFFIPPY